MMFFLMLRTSFLSYPGRLLRTLYAVVNDLIGCRIRPYFSVLHGPVLRSYISVIVYGDIRRKTEIVNDRIFTVHGRDLNSYGT